MPFFSGMHLRLRLLVLVALFLVAGAASCKGQERQPLVAVRASSSQKVILAGGGYHIPPNRWIEIGASPVFTIQRWFGSRVEQASWDTLQNFIIVLVVILLLFGGSIFWSWSLYRQVKLQIRDLRKSEEKYRLLVENASEGVLVTVGERLAFANPQAINLTGFSWEQLASLSVLDLFHPGDRDKVKWFTSLEPPGNDSDQNLFRILTSSKDTRWISINAAAIEWEGQPAILSLLTDVTERKLAEQALRESEERLERAEAFSLVMTTYTSLDGRWLKVPPTLCALLGYSEEELLSKKFTELTHPDDIEENWKQRHRLLRGEAKSFDIEKRFIRKDGGIVWVYVNSSIVCNKDGQPVHFLAYLRDITEHKRADEQIKRQLQHMAALRTVDMAITASVDLPLTLRVLLEQVRAQLEVDAASVLLLNPHTHTLENVASFGLNTHILKNSGAGVSEGYARLAAIERRLIHISDLTSEKDRFFNTSQLTAEGFTTYFGKPLIAKGMVKGVLELYNRSLLIPEAEWMNLLEALAGQAAIAIDNTMLFKDLQRANLDITLAYDATIEGWARALELRDRETVGHSQRVTEMVTCLAREIGIPDEEMIHMHRGALLHDIGKMGIPDNILLKPGPLTDDEWQVMRIHPTYSYELLSSVDFLRPALDIPYCHHEKWDGTGYPRGLKGDQIPLPARLFSVVDVYDALSYDRPFSNAWPREKVLQYIRSQAGKHFDPKVTEVFLSIYFQED